MGTILMYELLAEERAAQYRRETERDRQVALAAAHRRRAIETAAARASQAAVASAPGETLSPAAPRPAGTRRALAAAFVGLAAIGALRRRRVIAP